MTDPDPIASLTAEECDNDALRVLRYGAGTITRDETAAQLATLAHVLRRLTALERAQASDAPCGAHRDADTVCTKPRGHAGDHADQRSHHGGESWPASDDGEPRAPDGYWIDESHIESMTWPTASTRSLYHWGRVGEGSACHVPGVRNYSGCPEIRRDAVELCRKDAVSRAHPCTNADGTQEHRPQPAPPAERDRPAPGHRVWQGVDTTGDYDPTDWWSGTHETSGLPKWNGIRKPTREEAIAETWRHHDATHAHARERDRPAEGYRAYHCGGSMGDPWHAELLAPVQSIGWYRCEADAIAATHAHAHAAEAKAKGGDTAPDRAQLKGAYCHACGLRLQGVYVGINGEHVRCDDLEACDARGQAPVHRSQLIRKGLYGGASDPNRCVCAEKETGQYADTPHTHYAEPPHACARCRCKAYDPAVPPVAPAPVEPECDGSNTCPGCVGDPPVTTPAAQGARVLPPGYALYQRGVYWHWDAPDDEDGMHATSGVGEVSIADAIKGARAHAEQVETELRGAAGEETSK